MGNPVPIPPPGFEALSAEENQRRLESLRASLRERNTPFLEGAGHIPGESWREPSLFVRGLADGDIDRFARLHGQNGVLIVRVGAPATLRIYRADWRVAVRESSAVEWA